MSGSSQYSAREITLTPQSQRDLQILADTSLISIANEDVLISTEDARRAINLIVTAPISQQQVELQLQTDKHQQTIKELLAEGEKVTLERNKLRVDLALIQHSMQVDSGSACSHGDLEEKVRDLEKRLTDRVPDQVELKQDLEDTNAQLVAERKMKEEY